MTHQSSGADDCIDRVINKYARTVYKLAFARTRNKIEAEDIFQEVFLRYIRKRPVFENDEHAKAWFIRVTINCSKSFWSKYFRRRDTEPFDENIPVEQGLDYDLEYFLLKLPEDYRIVIHLFYYERMSTSQISILLNKKESTIRMQLTRARRLLKNIMEGDRFHV